MQLQTIDWAIMIGYFLVTILIGLWASKKAGKSSVDFFLSGRNMPWWLLGISMVATTFSADTPNLVTDIVRKNGVSGNWVWWAFLLTGMLTVFLYAKLWRRSGVMTDLEFYELRYSGKPAAFLRMFRAIYLGVLFNVVVMATVCLAAIKIGSVMFDLPAIHTLGIASVVTVLYSMLGGLRGILFTDFFQFILAMIGTVLAAVYILDLPQIGGLTNLLSQPEIQAKMAFIPQDDNMFMTLFLLPICVQWWASYYPGAEPGGGGYIAQRMLAAKDEKHAVAATFVFNVMHYALRPWPWILIAFASIIVFPDHASLAAKFPNIDASIINDDLAYPAMLTFLPAGLLGVILASLFAGFMSTISSHLNWGSSYIVNDVYHRFVNPHASEKQLVVLGRISTAVMMVLGALLALTLTSAEAAFQLIIMLGAGTGLIYILRWFWWRINAYTEIAAMICSFLIALYFHLWFDGSTPEDVGYMPGHHKLLYNIVITTVVWLIVTYATRPTENEKLVSFYEKIKPFSPGWKVVIVKNKLSITKDRFGSKLLAIVLGIVLVYGSLFGTGYLIYGETLNALIALSSATIAGVILYKIWNRVG